MKQRSPQPPDDPGRSWRRGGKDGKGGARSGADGRGDVAVQEAKETEVEEDGAADLADLLGGDDGPDLDLGPWSKEDEEEWIQGVTPEDAQGQEKGGE